MVYVTLLRTCNFFTIPFLLIYIYIVLFILYSIDYDELINVILTNKMINLLNGTYKTIDWVCTLSLIKNTA